jgi:hypothetical protein
MNKNCLEYTLKYNVFKMTMSLIILTHTIISLITKSKNFQKTVGIITILYFVGDIYYHLLCPTKYDIVIIQNIISIYTFITMFLGDITFFFPLYTIITINETIMAIKIIYSGNKYKKLLNNFYLGSLIYTRFIYFPLLTVFITIYNIQVINNTIILNMNCFGIWILCFINIVIAVDIIKKY